MQGALKYQSLVYRIRLTCGVGHADRAFGHWGRLAAVCERKRADGESRKTTVSEAKRTANEVEAHCNKSAKGAAGSNERYS